MATISWTTDTQDEVLDGGGKVYRRALNKTLGATDVTPSVLVEGYELDWSASITAIDVTGGGPTIRVILETTEDTSVWSPVASFPDITSTGESWMLPHHFGGATAAKWADARAGGQRLPLMKYVRFRVEAAGTITTSSCSIFFVAHQRRQFV